jgi:hypothetical protein
MMKYNEIKLVWHLALYVLTFAILRTSTPPKQNSAALRSKVFADQALSKWSL